jgi:regulator of protease activity HflC (stomatin/prohibitin superfamily)
MGTFIWIVIIAVWVTALVLKKNKMTWMDLFQKMEAFQKRQGPVKAEFNKSTGSYTTSSPSSISSLNTFISMLKKRILLGVGVLALLVLLFNMVLIVPAGKTGVQQLFGKVRDVELKSGFHLINPLTSVEHMSIRTEQYTMSIAPAEGQVKGDDSISSLTKEGLDVNIDFTALYRLEEDRAAEIYREVGLDYVGKLIRPEIRGVIRDVVSQYEAKDLYSEKRQEASIRMEAMLKERLEGRGIIIEQAVIRNVQLPASLAKAIQEKLASEQESQRYDFVLEKEKKEAERKRIEAEGQRDAQRIIDESLSAGYLNYLYIKELKDRDGTIYVPVNPENGLPMFKGVE